MSSETDKIFVERLRAVRMQREITQTALAGMTQIPQGRLSAFEGGYRTPGPTELVAIADALDMDLDFLLGRSPRNARVTPQTQRLLQKIERLTKRDLDVLSTFVDGLAKQRKR